jgi:hypothetical protein
MTIKDILKRLEDILWACEDEDDTDCWQEIQQLARDLYKEVNK